MDSNATLDDVTRAYIRAVLAKDPCIDDGTPLFKSLAFIDGLGWLEVSFNLSREWVQDVPESAKKLLSEAQLDAFSADMGTMQ